jgi:hypothetical protein
MVIDRRPRKGSLYRFVSIIHKAGGLSLAAGAL